MNVQEKAGDDCGRPVLVGFWPTYAEYGAPNRPQPIDNSQGVIHDYTYTLNR